MSDVPLPQVLWHDLQADRLGWAYRAYRRFIAELSDDVRTHFSQGGTEQEPYVVVFGKTQVGKTTLLLELMGLDTAGQVRVGKVLRGGRESGRSATATTMEYRRSPDCTWYLNEGEGARSIASDDEICSALGDLRERMSAQRLLVDRPVVVSIPANCFARDMPGVSTRMLDLPGDNPVDEIERKHVQEMAGRYVPYADLILLVGRGDDLSFLNPDALSLPSIEDWQFVPNRFRIITTYSFTPHTVRQFVRNCAGDLDTESMRKRLLEQIGTFGLVLSPEASRLERYFPLEFGESWQAMVDKDVEFAQHIAPVLTSLKSQLHADIRASANEAARFRNALDVHVVARHKRTACVERCQAAVNKITACSSKAAALEKEAAEGERKADKRCKELRTLLSSQDAVLVELADLHTFDATRHMDEAHALKETNTSALFLLINNFTAWLRQHFLEMDTIGITTRKFLGNSRPRLSSHASEITGIADTTFGTLSAHMHDYWSDEYYPSLSGDFERDKARLRSGMHEAAAQATSKTHDLWIKHIAKRTQALESELDAADGERLSMQQIANEQRAKQKRHGASVEAIEGQMASDLARLDSDAGAATRFGATLDGEYLAEVLHRREHIALSDTPAGALLTLLSVAGLGDERRKIKLL